MDVCFGTHTHHTLPLLINKQHATLQPLLFPALLAAAEAGVRSVWGVMWQRHGRLLPLGIRGKADACSLWGRAALEMVAMCYHSSLFPCFCRFALATLCRCNSFEFFFQLAFKYLLCYLGFLNVCTLICSWKKRRQSLAAAQKSATEAWLLIKSLSVG